MPYYDEGLYSARIKGQGFGELPNEKKTPYFFLEFLPHSIVDPTIEGHPVIEHISPEYSRDVKLYVTDKAMDRTIAKLQDMGWTGQSFRDLDPDTPNYHSFNGVDIEVKCFHEQSGENFYDRWELPGTGGNSNVVNMAGLSRKLDTIHGKALKKGAAPPQNPTAKHETVPPADDAVPPADDAVPPDDEVPF